MITTCIRKGLAKQILFSAGIPTPAFRLFSKASGSFDLPYPAFVKPADDDASVGISHKSVVHNQKEMLDRVGNILRNYQQDALVEEFIEGREFAVSIWGNGNDIRVLPIAEMDYSKISNAFDRILTYESKWEEGTFEFENIQSLVPAKLESMDEVRIKDIGKRAYIAVGLRDFGRVDIRYREGIPFVIDINEIPDLGPNDGFSKSTRAAGYSHEDTIEQILLFAMEREGLI